MSVDMGMLSIGNEYIRDTLAELWGYNGRQAISRGIVTPANEKKIILFVTKIKQKSDTQYQDYFIEEGLLHMEGENSHKNDSRLVDAESNGESIYLFYREIHHTPFIYYGEVYLVDYKIYTNKPSVFIFSNDYTMSISLRGLADFANGISSVNEIFIPDKEGAAKLKFHINYERSPRNRAKAIEIHGTVCKACGFDFDKFYGVNLSRHFIEIHHILPISTLKESMQIDPRKDLVPLCSNCHRMIHRSRDIVMSIEELKIILDKQKKMDRENK